MKEVEFLLKWIFLDSNFLTCKGNLFFNEIQTNWPSSLSIIMIQRLIFSMLNALILKSRWRFILFYSIVCHVLGYIVINLCFIQLVMHNPFWYTFLIRKQKNKKKIKKPKSNLSCTTPKLLLKFLTDKMLLKLVRFA